MGWRMSQQSSNEMDPVPEEYLILFETIWFQIQPKCQKKKKKHSQTEGLHQKGWDLKIDLE